MPRKKLLRGSLRPFRDSGTRSARTSPAPVARSPFLDTLEARFGLSTDDWAAILSAVRTAKACEGEAPSDDGLDEITPFLFVGSRFRSEKPRHKQDKSLANRDRFFEVLGLALELGEISVGDLQETVLLDDADSRIIIRGIAVPEGRGSSGRAVWDTSHLKLELTRRWTFGLLPNLPVRWAFWRLHSDREVRFPHFCPDQKLGDPHTTRALISAVGCVMGPRAIAF